MQIRNLAEQIIFNLGLLLGYLEMENILSSYILLKNLCFTN